MYLFGLLCILLAVTNVYSYNTGSPLCVDDMKQMEAGMGLATGRYTNMTVTLTSNSYNYSDTITNFTFRLISKELPRTFKGLLLYAQAGEEHVGSWEDIPTDFKALDEQCKKFGGPSTTITHSNGENKSSTTFFHWTAPTKPVGQIQIRGIIVFNDTTSWVSISPLFINGPANATNGTDDDQKNSSAPSQHNYAVKGNTKLNYLIFIPLLAFFFF